MIDRLKGLDRGGETSAEPGSVGGHSEDLMNQARERLAAGQQMVQHYIVQNPARALGVALGMGVLLGWLIKRR